MAGASHGDARTPQRDIPTPEAQDFVPGSHNKEAAGAGSMSSKAWFSPPMPQQKA